MKLPGRAWLEFDVVPAAGGGAIIHQTAVFEPVGLFGLLYWYVLLAGARRDLRGHAARDWPAGG